jgi:hypothetical protein
MVNKLYDKVILKEEREKSGYRYSYELTERKGDSTIDFGVYLYSIKVDMIDDRGKSRHSEAKDLFSSKEKALSFFDMIVKHLVTPIDLKYIIEDELGYLK